MEHHMPMLKGVEPLYLPEFDCVTDVTLINHSNEDSFKEDTNSKIHKAFPTDKEIIPVAVSGQQETISNVTPFGVTLASPIKTGRTDLHQASLHNHPSLVNWLTSNGEKINETKKDEILPLIVSAYVGDFAMTQDFLNKGAAVNKRDKYGRTALMAGSQEGHDQIVKLLIVHQADVTMKSKTGKTALFYAAMKNQKHTIECLLEENMHLIDLKDNNGSTVLSLCAFNGNTEIVRFLHENGASINAKDDSGRTPLMGAVQEAKWETVKYLIDNGASTGIKTIDGKTALDFALAKPYTMTDEAEMLKYFARNLDIPHNNGDTPLKPAAFKGHTVTGEAEMLKYFAGNIDKPDNNGDTPLITAAYKGNIDTVRIILKKSKNINHQNKCGITALMTAVHRNYISIVKLLIESHADVNLSSSNGLFALQLATSKEMIKILTQADAKECFPTTDKGRITNVLLAAISESTMLLEKMLRNGVDVNTQNDQRLSPLMLASLHGRLDNVALLLHHGAVVNHMNDHGMTAIAYAVEGHHIKVIDLLIGYGADINIENKLGETMLYTSADFGNEFAVEELIYLGANVNCKNRDGKTPLMAAAASGHLKVVKLLIKMGAESDLCCHNEMNARHYAFINKQKCVEVYLEDYELKKTNDQFQINGDMLLAACQRNDVGAVERLLDAGFPVDFPDNFQGRTPLMMATALGHLPVALLLIQKYANINKSDFEGTTPLIIASLFGHLQLVELLLKQGANPNFQEKNKGFTALMSASQNGHANVVCCLVKHRSLLNIQGRGGYSSLVFATLLGHFDIMNTLLEHGARVDNLDIEQRTPLSAASLEGFLVIVELLHKHHANINHQDIYGRTALMSAAQTGSLPIVEYLVNHGAEIDVVTINNRTAKDYAIVKGHVEVWEWLNNKGAPGECEKNFNDYSSEDLIISKNIIHNYQCIYPTPPENSKKIVRNISKHEEKTAQQKLFDICHRECEGEKAIRDAITEGADINCPNEYACTALMIASHNNFGHHIEWLLNYGAEVNCTDGEWKTPLMHAIKHNDVKTVQILLQNNADTKMKNSDGDDALSYAMKEGNNDITECIKISRKLNNQTISHTNNMNKLDQCGLLEELISGETNLIKTAIESKQLQYCDVSILCNSVHWAVLSNEKVFLDYLNGSGLNMNTFLFENHETMLFIGVRRGNVLITKHMLQYGLHVNHQNKDGQTCLMLACLNGFTEIVECLLQHSANTTVKNVNGEDALEVAIKNSNFDIARIIMMHCSSNVVMVDDIIILNEKDVAGESAENSVIDENKSEEQHEPEKDVAGESAENSVIDENKSEEQHEPAPEELLDKRQRFQNCLAKTVTKSSKYASATVALKTLHLLPLHSLIAYKINVFSRSTLAFSPDEAVSLKARDCEAVSLKILHEFMTSMHSLIGAMFTSMDHIDKEWILDVSEFDKVDSTFLQAVDILHKKFPHLLCKSSKERDSLLNGQHLKKQALENDKILYKLNEIRITSTTKNESVRHGLAKEEKQVTSKEQQILELDLLMKEKMIEIDTLKHDLEILENCVLEESNNLVLLKKENSMATREKEILNLEIEVIKKEIIQETNRQILLEDTMVDLEKRLGKPCAGKEVKGVRSPEMTRKNFRRESKLFTEINKLTKDIAELKKELKGHQSTSIAESEQESVPCCDETLNDKSKDNTGKENTTKDEDCLQELKMIKKLKQMANSDSCSVTGCNKKEEDETKYSSKRNSVEDTDAKLSGVKYLQKYYNLVKKDEIKVEGLSDKKLIPEKPKQKTEVTSVLHGTMMTYYFPHEVCDYDGWSFPSTSCGIITLLYAIKYKRHPTVLCMDDVSDTIYQQIIDAIKEGKHSYKLYFEQQYVRPEASDIILMTNPSVLSITDQLEFESDHHATVVEYVMKLENNQVMLLFREHPYKVVSICTGETDSIQMFDSQSHYLVLEGQPGSGKLYGSILFKARKTYSCVWNLFDLYNKLNYELKGKCKFVVIEIANY